MVCQLSFNQGLTGSLAQEDFDFWPQLYFTNLCVSYILGTNTSVVGLQTRLQGEVLGEVHQETGH